jgi:hypothetical protein
LLASAVPQPERDTVVAKAKESATERDVFKNMDHNISDAMHVAGAKGVHRSYRDHSAIEYRSRTKPYQEMLGRMLPREIDGTGDRAIQQGCSSTMGAH